MRRSRDFALVLAAGCCVATGHNNWLYAPIDRRAPEPVDDPGVDWGSVKTPYQ